MLKHLLKDGIFFDADTGTGGTGDTGDTTSAEPVATPTPEKSERAKPTRITDVLKKADKIDAPKPKGEETTPEPGEGVTKEPEEKELLVKGPSTTKQPAPEPGEESETPSEDEPKTGEPGVNTVELDGKVKVGDLEFTGQQILGLAKDAKNNQDWSANLTKRSQIASKIGNDVLNDVVPYALSQRKLPENIKEELAKIEELPEEITVKDEDGYDHQIMVKDLPADFLEQLKSAILVQTFPEYQKIVDENNEIKTESTEMKESIARQDEERGTSAIIDFMKNNPDFAVTLYQGDRLPAVIDKVLKAGPDNPEYANVKRLTTIMLGVHEGIYETFDEAQEGLFPKSPKKTATDQVLKNQQAGKPETPGGKTGPPHTGRELVGKMAKRGKGAKYAKLGR